MDIFFLKFVIKISKSDGKIARIDHFLPVITRHYDHMFREKIIQVFVYIASSTYG